MKPGTEDSPRAAYDRAFETLCFARRELDMRMASGADRETLKCFEAILASAQRQYVRTRNAFAMRLLEGIGAPVPAPWIVSPAAVRIPCEPRMCCAV